MSDKDDPNPFEDMPKHIRDMLKNPNLATMFQPFAGGNAPKSESGSGASSGTTDEQDKVLKKIRDFNLKPREIRDYLDRFVIRQDEAKKVLSVAICDHFNHVRQCLEDPELAEKDYAKQNIILLGPTGVGKTYLMRCIARHIGVPFVKADATKFSETGYVGHDVEDLVRDLVKAADGNVDLAEYGIIYVDEIDKIAGQANQTGRDVSGRGVQINLLKLMEETDVNLHSQTDILGQMQAMMEMQQGGKPRKKTINTRHILFIVSGAFGNLTDEVRKRLNRSQIGFSTAGAGMDDDDTILEQVQTSDFISYGFEPEFIGRLPVRVACHHLNDGDLKSILLQSEGSILAQYRTDFRGYGIDFDLTPEAVSKIAQRAQEEKTGARGLMTVLERIFRNYKYELPSTSIRSFEVTTRTVDTPEETLTELLEENKLAQIDVLKEEVAQFVERFRGNCGLEIAFDDEAVEVLVSESVRSGKTIRALCEQKFHDFVHGLMLISRNTGRKRFTVDRDAAMQPDKELSRWVVESFRAKENSSQGESDEEGSGGTKQEH